MSAAIITPVLILCGLGGLFGAILAFASRKFCVPIDPRLDEVFKRLPGANCGACGMAGCMGFAEGLIAGKCSIDKCPVTKAAMRGELARILGIEHRETVRTTAVLHCHGGSVRAKDKYEYYGVRDCRSANQIMGGPKSCAWGCIGYGTCAAVCPFGAISMNAEGLPLVNEERCTACGKCVSACPKKLFTLQRVTAQYATRCMSQELGRKVMDVCSVGCIACRKCEKACPTGAIKVLNNLAVFDYALCDNRGECYKVCPTKAIAKKENGQWTVRE